jgi:hypothetical protein
MLANRRAVAETARNTNMVSTASRVLTPTEQRYTTTCEQELLAITFALNKSRVYTYGHKICLNTDNKSLTFIHKCAITLNRVARWLLELQKYYLEMNHISGASNCLADVLSRNPSRLNAAEIKNLTTPAKIIVNEIYLNFNHTIRKNLKTSKTPDY